MYDIPYDSDMKVHILSWNLGQKQFQNPEFIFCLIMNKLTPKRLWCMATKFSENFTIGMLKKHGKICRRSLTHLNATPTFENRSRDLWATL